MSNIIGNVGRRSLKVRLLNVAMHIILFLGALTMIYPFLIMLSGSVKSSLDFKYFNIVPEYLVNDIALFRKYVLSKYNGNTMTALNSLNDRAVSIEKINPPDFPSGSVLKDFVEMTEKPPAGVTDYCFGVGFVIEPGYYPLMARKFVAWLKGQYGDFDAGLYKMNKDLGSEYSNWEEVSFPGQYFLRKKARTDYSSSKMFLKFKEFKDTQTSDLTKYIMNVDGYYIDILQRDYGKHLDKLNEKLGTGFISWRQIIASEKCPAGNPKLAKFWENFVRRELNIQFVGVSQDALPAYRAFLRAQYSDIKKLNTLYGSQHTSFDQIAMPSEPPTAGQLMVDWNDFITEKAPLSALSVRGFNYCYRQWLKAKYSNNTQALNNAYERGFRAFSDIPLPESEPENNLRLRNDWNEFVNKLSVKEIALKRSSVPEYRKYLGELYGAKGSAQPADLSAMSQDYNQKIASSEQIPAFQFFPADSTDKARDHYESAVKKDHRFRELRSIKNPAAVKDSWSAFLKEKYQDAEKFNAAMGYTVTSFDTMPVPAKEIEWGIFMKNRKFLKSEYLWRNYAMVFDTILINGKAARNTVIYCVLAMLAALIVNPLAAYALSRWRPPSTYKVLLLLMLTMAFPPMVIGIPNFLTIKNLGLLNTFAALILPGMASGYSIFLLKGFFDSLPKELFECATLDGAGEWTMFWHIAMTLSKPILAVIALGAFLGAYGNFMMAFILCQDPGMWTMMVYIYQLQQRAGPAVGFASLVVAAIPTLLVFIFCQNMIIKGIVVPTEK